MSNRIFRILELVWLFFTCIAILLCVYSIIGGDYRDSIFFLVITFAAGLIYAVRRKQRIRFEAALKQKEEEQKK